MSERAATYVCAMCRETFEKGWSDEEAQDEAAELFGEIAPDEQAVVCEDCFQKMTAAYPPEQFRADVAALAEKGTEA